MDITTLEIDTDVIDKYDNKTWRTIYKAIHETYFVEVKLCTDDFLEQ